MSPNESLLLDQVCNCMLIEALAVNQTGTIHTYRLTQGPGPTDSPRGQVQQTHPGARSSRLTQGPGLADLPRGQV